MATLEGKKVVIIGGTSGIGYAVAKASLVSLAEHVLVASSSPDKVQAAVSRLCAEPGLQKLQPGLSKRISGEVVDMTNTESIKAFFAKVGEIDHLAVTSGRFPGTTDFKAIELSQAQGKLQQSRVPTSTHHGSELAFFNERIWSIITAVQSAKLRKGGSITLTVGMCRHLPFYYSCALLMSSRATSS